MRFLYLLATLAITAGASVIAGPGSFINVAGNSVVTTTVPGNNNHPGGNSPNTININETAFAIPIAMSVSFNVFAEPFGQGASTEYAVSKTILNNTGETWTVS